MEHGSHLRYVLGLAAALAVGTAGPLAGYADRGEPVVEHSTPPNPVAAALDAPAFDLEIGGPDDDVPAAATHRTPPLPRREHTVRGRGAPDHSPSLALRGFLTRPSRAPPALSG